MCACFDAQLGSLHKNARVLNTAAAATALFACCAHAAVEHYPVVSTTAAWVAIADGGDVRDEASHCSTQPKRQRRIGTLRGLRSVPEDTRFILSVVVNRIGVLARAMMRPMLHDPCRDVMSASRHVPSGRGIATRSASARESKSTTAPCTWHPGIYAHNAIFCSGGSVPTPYRGEPNRHASRLAIIGGCIHVPHGDRTTMASFSNLQTLDAGEVYRRPDGVVCAASASHAIWRTTRTRGYSPRMMMNHASAGLGGGAPRYVVIYPGVIIPSNAYGPGSSRWWPPSHVMLPPGTHAAVVPGALDGDTTNYDTNAEFWDTGDFVKAEPLPMEMSSTAKRMLTHSRVYLFDSATSTFFSITPQWERDWRTYVHIKSDDDRSLDAPCARTCHSLTLFEADSDIILDGCYSHDDIADSSSTLHIFLFGGLTYEHDGSLQRYLGDAYWLVVEKMKRPVAGGRHASAPTVHTDYRISFRWLPVKPLPASVHESMLHEPGFLQASPNLRGGSAQVVPCPRMGHTTTALPMSDAEGGHVIVLFGGQGRDGVLNDVWVLALVGESPRQQRDVNESRPALGEPWCPTYRSALQTAWHVPFVLGRRPAPRTDHTATSLYSTISLNAPAPTTNLDRAIHALQVDGTRRSVVITGGRNARGEQFRDVFLFTLVRTRLDGRYFAQFVELRPPGPSRSWPCARNKHSATYVPSWPPSEHSIDLSKLRQAPFHVTEHAAFDSGGAMIEACPAVDSSPTSWRVAGGIIVYGGRDFGRHSVTNDVDSVADDDRAQPEPIHGHVNAVHTPDDFDGIVAEVSATLASEINGNAADGDDGGGIVINDDVDDVDDDDGVGGDIGDADMDDNDENFEQAENDEDEVEDAQRTTAVDSNIWVLRISLGLDLPLLLGGASARDVSSELAEAVELVREAWLPSDMIKRLEVITRRSILINSTRRPDSSRALDMFSDINATLSSLNISYQNDAAVSHIGDVDSLRREALNSVAELCLYEHVNCDARSRSNHVHQFFPLGSPVPQVLPYIAAVSRLIGAGAVWEEAQATVACAGPEPMPPVPPSSFVSDFSVLADGSVALSLHNGEGESRRMPQRSFAKVPFPSFVLEVLDDQSGDDKCDNHESEIGPEPDRFSSRLHVPLHTHRWLLRNRCRTFANMLMPDEDCVGMPGVRRALPASGVSEPVTTSVAGFRESREHRALFGEATALTRRTATMLLHFFATDTLHASAEPSDVMKLLEAAMEHDLPRLAALAEAALVSVLDVDNVCGLLTFADANCFGDGSGRVTTRDCSTTTSALMSRGAPHPVLQTAMRRREINRRGGCETLRATCVAYLMRHYATLRLHPDFDALPISLRDEVRHEWQASAHAYRGDREL